MPTTRSTIGASEQSGKGVQVRVRKIESVAGKANGPGEIAGPALRVSVTVENGSGKAISLDAAIVNLYYGKDRTPANPLSGPGASDFGGGLGAGRSTTGRYVFGVPKDQRDDIEVEFSYTADAPTVIFTGAA